MSEFRYPPGDASTARLLVVDDEESVLDMLSRFLTRKGYLVTTATNGRTALELFRDQPFDLVLSDVRMPVITGLQLLRAVKDINPRVPVILISGYGDVETVVQALKNGAENFLSKPLKMSLLERVLEQALAISCIRPGATQLQTDLCQITQIKVASRSEYITEVVYQISLSAVAVGFAEYDLDNNLKLALVEALTNAMEHGNGWDQNKLVKVEAKLRRESLEVTIEDQGSGFDFSHCQDPTSDENLLSERGRGIFLMQAIMDQVEFTPPGNRVTMTKHRLPGKERT